MNRRLVTGFKVVVGTHALLTCASLTYNTYVDNDPSREGKPNEVFDAGLYRKVTNMVTEMYSGKGVIETREVRLAQNATFEDPAAICSTPNEIREAFRALKAARPSCISQPKCIDVRPNGESIELTYHLNQRYGGFLNLQSLLLVDFHLARAEDGITEGHLVVTKLEERWNGTRPLGALPFWISRRINGLISWNLTRILVGEGK